jgi:phospholipid-binding lipoprotein MlaA
MAVRARALRGALWCGLLLAGCAAPAGVREWDPWEGFNRKMFWFNERVDEYALEPAAKGWEAITSHGVRESVADFGENLRFPVHFVNNVLQLNLGDALRCTGRFVVNTTVGVLGFFDPATGWGLPAERADFGETLAHWGLEEGPYLVLPFLGPSNPRDAVGLAGDWYVVNVLPLTGEAVLAVYVTTTVNWRALNLDNIAEARQASFDYYTAVRSAWLDNRRRSIGVMLPPEEPPPGQPSETLEDPYDVDAAINP